MGNSNINVRYEHQNNSNYLVIEDEKEYEEYQYKMLRRNKPDHFLKMSMYSVNSKYGIYYDITSKQQVSKFYEYGKMTMEDVKSICVNISEMVRIADDYMLDIDHVKIEPKYIYMDVGTKKLYFVYHTNVNSNTFNEGLKMLFEFILEHFDHSLDKKCIVKLYEIYQKVLVGEYDPFNLIKMFGMPEKQNYEEKIVRKGTEQVNTDRIEKEEIKKEVKKEIPTVFPEQILVDKEEKQKKSSSKLPIAGVIIMLFGFINIIMPDIIPLNLPEMVYFGCVGAGVGILLYSSRKKKIPDDTVTHVEKEEMPYTIREDEKTNNENDIKDANNIKAANNIKTATDKTETVPDIYDDICNETMLLSDYVGTKRKKKSLKLHLLDDNFTGWLDIHTPEEENTRTITMNKYPYIIGSLGKMSDVVVNSQVVSRMHCCVYHENNQDDIYSVEDLNATNGTYINGERLNNHEKIQLHDKDVLKLAAIAFEVEIS